MIHGDRIFAIKLTDNLASSNMAEQIDTTRMKSPAFKMILTATGEYAYRRPEDGIYVIPIGCLKP